MVKPRSKKKLPRPYVMATFAMTIDGKITSREYSPVDFTSREDKRHLIRQRSLGDAVILGSSSLRRDNVRLGVPDPALREARVQRGQAPYPLRVILSSNGLVGPDLNIFQTDFSPIVIFSTKRMPKKYREALRGKATLHLGDGHDVHLVAMLQTLRREYKVRTVACEGGPTLFRALLERGLVDQLNLTIAPFLFGGRDAPTLTGVDRSFLPRSIPCRLTDMRIVADECFLTYRIKNRL
jgi:riboflavin-specific deaminase-like protein